MPNRGHLAAAVHSASSSSSETRSAVGGELFCSGQFTDSVLVLATSPETEEIHTKFRSGVNYPRRETLQKEELTRKLVEEKSRVNPD